MPALLALLIMPLLPMAVQADSISAELSASDAVTVPGRKVQLEARLVRAGMLVETGLGGEQLEFVLAGKKVGTAMTGGDGRAYLEYTPTMRGNSSLTVRVLPNKRVHASEATATLASWERRRPILLVECRVLMEERPRGPLPDLGVLQRSDPEPVNGSADELKRLSEFYFNIVYLERQNDTMPLLPDFREWLKQHGFPFGLRVKVTHDGERMGETIDDLRADGWENLQAGVAQSRDVLDALLKHRIRAILIGSERDKDLPRRIEYARDWKEARKLLQR